MTIAFYCRVSTTDKQELTSQQHTLSQWAKGQTDDVVWFTDKASGKDQNRPGFQKMMEAVRAGKVSRIVVAGLDRLGRNTIQLLTLVEELKRHHVGLLSLRESFDPTTPMGQFCLTCMAAMAQLEREITGDRIRAGQAAAKAAGKQWGGRKVGTRIAVTVEKEAAIVDMSKQGKGISEIARVLELSRNTVYAVLGRQSL